MSSTQTDISVYSNSDYTETDFSVYKYSFRLVGLLTYDRSSKSHFWDFMIPPKPTVVCRNETDPGRFKRASKNVHILKFSAPVV